MIGFLVSIIWLSYELYQLNQLTVEAKNYVMTLGIVVEDDKTAHIYAIVYNIAVLVLISTSVVCVRQKCICLTITFSFVMIVSIIIQIVRFSTTTPFYVQDGFGLLFTLVIAVSALIVARNRFESDSDLD